EVRPDPNTAVTYAILASSALYDLTQSSMAAEVVQVLPPAPEAYTILEAKHQGDTGTRVFMINVNGELYAGENVGGVFTGTPLTYDPVAHRWWRIREAGGTTYWEVSADGCGWTVIRSAPNPIPLTTVQVLLDAGTDVALADPGVAIFDNFNIPRQVVPLPDRRQQAYDTRVQAAAIARDRAHPAHVNNGEECDYPYVANFSKGLQHDGNGDVIPASYQSLLTALSTRDPNDFEAIQLGGPKKLTNPQGGLAFTLEGADPAAVTQPPAPRIDTPQNSGEMGELYWMALARDVHFADYGSSAIVQAAITSLNTEFSDFRGPRENGAVTTQTVFRGIFPGETTGPYLSQFLLKGNSDPRVGDNSGQGRRTFEGLITYGDLKIDQRQLTVVPGMDYLTDFNTWLDAQNGWDFRGMDVLDDSQRRFIRNLRDLGERVHIDNVGDMFFNACLILLHEPPGNQIAGGGVIGRDMEFVWDQGNPYLAYAKQAPFVTLGAPHALSLVWEALIRALRAVWFQKWFVHRRLRPEEFGGRIHNHLTNQRTYPQIDGEILDALTSGGLAPYFGDLGDAFETYLLPQAYAEGAPTHPAYGAGHATGAGACTTVLKALFNESSDIQAPMIANADGTALELYTGPGADVMTLGGELNKLAGNIAYGRNAAGVHWRSDADQSLLLGERIGIALLQEQSLLLNEPEFYQVTKFDGTTIRIQDGVVTVV
ncbi:MAG TPA: hypothetical protein VLK84_28390, partial [Longimicrobium sp.]|nr:hypothetical protein [Longimicrobium sp.]